MSKLYDRLNIVQTLKIRSRRWVRQVVRMGEGVGGENSLYSLDVLIIPKETCGKAKAPVGG